MNGDQTVPVFAPDGTLGDIPKNRLNDAIKAGGQMGFEMIAPDGSTGVVPANRVHEAIAAGGLFKGQAAPAGPVPLQMQSSSLPGYALGAGNVLTGAGKGALHTIYTGGDIIRQATGMPRVITDPNVQAAITPTTGTQKVGYGVEQAGEFLLPSTEAATIPERIGLGALGGGTINRAQGRSFVTGAVLGGLGQGASEGAAAIAPSAAESALGTSRLQRAYGKTPGQAAITETTGIAPEAVAASADQQIQNLTTQLYSAAQAAPGMGTVQPAIDVIDSAINTATKRNNQAAINTLQELRSQLTQHVVTGQDLPISRNAEGILEAKRGIGDLINTWDPIRKTQYSGVKKQIYNALDQQLDALVPESKDLNQRISSLIPVRDQARNQALGSGIVQSSWERFARPTGALIGGLEGARAGYQAYGLPGAIAGGTLGVVAPSVISSPEFRMGMARALANPAARQALTRGGIGALMQFMQSNPPQ